MSSPDRNAFRYTVDMSMAVYSQGQTLHYEAAQQGRGMEFIHAYEEAIRHLKIDPLEFGEPLYHLQKLNLQIRHGAISPLVVTYGVHLEQPLVFIQGFRLLS